MGIGYVIVRVLRVRVRINRMHMSILRVIVGILSMIVRVLRMSVGGKFGRCQNMSLFSASLTQNVKFSLCRIQTNRNPAFQVWYIKCRRAIPCSIGCADLCKQRRIRDSGNCWTITYHKT